MPLAREYRIVLCRNCIRCSKTISLYRVDIGFHFQFFFVSHYMTLERALNHLVIRLALNYVRQVGYVLVVVCLSVCLSVTLSVC